MFKRCIIHFSIEVAQEEIHTLDIQLFSDKSPLGLFIKVWRQLTVVSVRYVSIFLIYLSCSELFWRLESILRHNLTVSHGHVFIFEKVGFRYVLFLICCKQVC